MGTACRAHIYFPWVGDVGHWPHDRILVLLPLGTFIAPLLLLLLGDGVGLCGLGGGGVGLIFFGARMALSTVIYHERYNAAHGNIPLWVMYNTHDMKTHTLEEVSTFGGERTHYQKTQEMIRLETTLLPHDATMLKECTPTISMMEIHKCCILTMLAKHPSVTKCCSWILEEYT